MPDDNPSTPDTPNSEATQPCDEEPDLSTLRSGYDPASGRPRTLPEIDAGTAFSVEYNIEGADRQPVVQLLWGDHYARLLPAEARAIAAAILGAVSAAEADALFARFLTLAGAREDVVEAAIHRLRTLRENTGATR